MEQEQLIQVVLVAQLLLHALIAELSPELKMLIHVVVQTHALKHQGEDKLDQMVLVRNVPIMRSSSVAFVGDNLVLHQAILLIMVNAFDAIDTKKLVESLVYQKDAIKLDTSLVELTMIASCAQQEQCQAQIKEYAWHQYAHKLSQKMVNVLVAMNMKDSTQQQKYVKIQTADHQHTLQEQVNV